MQCQVRQTPGAQTMLGSEIRPGSIVLALEHVQEYMVGMRIALNRVECNEWVVQETHKEKS